MVWILLAILFAILGAALLYWGRASTGLMVLGIVCIVIAVILVFLWLNNDEALEAAWHSRQLILRS